jgi:hypothetical protein
MAAEEMTSLYDRDFFEWTWQVARLIREGRFAEIDVEHLAEEIEDVGKRDQRGVWGHLRIVIHHLLKWQLQPERRSRSWRTCIWTHRDQLRDISLNLPAWNGMPKNRCPKSIIGRYEGRWTKPVSPANVFQQLAPTPSTKSWISISCPRPARPLSRNRDSPFILKIVGLRLWLFGESFTACAGAGLIWEVILGSLPHTPP